MGMGRGFAILKSHESELVLGINGDKIEHADSYESGTTSTYVGAGASASANSGTISPLYSEVPSNGHLSYKVYDVIHKPLRCPHIRM